jgi:hypothetical protein
MLKKIRSAMSGDNKEESSEKRALDIVKSVKKPLAKYRKPFERAWNKEEDAYYGDIWENSSEYRPYENTVFQVIEAEVPVLTDSIPGIVAKTTDIEKQAQVRNLSRSIDWVLKDQSFPLMHPIVARKSLISAPGFIYTWYDPNALSGDGEIKLEIIPWQQVYLYSRTGFLEDSTKARFEVDRSKDELMLAYPRSAEKISKMKSKSDTDTDPIDTDRGRETYDTGGRYNRKKPHKYVDEDDVRLVITYKKDYTIVPILEEQTMEELQMESEALQGGDSPDVKKWQDHEKHMQAHFAERAQLLAVIQFPPGASFEEAEQMVASILEQNPEAEEGLTQGLLQLDHLEAHDLLMRENPKSGQLKYPNGWRVIESIQKTIVYDGKSRCEHNQIPLTPFHCYHDGTTYGFGEVRNILDSQMMAAVMDYKEYKGLQRVANPGVAVTISSGLTEDDISNDDGAFYRTESPRDDIVALQPGVVSEQVGRFSQRRVDKMQDISGMVEATQGKMPAPNASGVTVDKIQQQAIGRVRLKNRINEHYSIKRLGCHIAAEIIQNWDTEKVIEMEDTKNNVAEIVFDPAEMRDLVYEIDISQGSMVGVDKNSYNALLSQFMATQQISLKQLLQVGEFPKSEQLLALIEENEGEELQQAMAQIQQIQMEFIKFKGGVDTELLSPEEKNMYEEILRNEEIERIQEGGVQ